MITHRVLITGRVQGVGFRDWLTRHASRHGVHGWVRNVGRDAVEAVLHGEEDAVALVLALCREGPPGALVREVTVEATSPPEAGFQRRGSVE
jgi:acylphosphatase